MSFSNKMPLERHQSGGSKQPLLLLIVRELGIFVPPLFLPSLLRQKSIEIMLLPKQTVFWNCLTWIVDSTCEAFARSRKNCEFNGMMTAVGWQRHSSSVIILPDGGVKCGVWHFCVPIHCPLRKCWATKEGSWTQRGLWSGDTWQNGALIIVIFILVWKAWAYSCAECWYLFFKSVDQCSHDF